MDFQKENDKDKFSKEIELEGEIFLLTFEKLNDSKITITCENKYDYLSLYNYTIVLTYDEFLKLAKTFRLFDNIDEIFFTIKNLVIGVEFSFKKDNSSYMSTQNTDTSNNNQMNNPNMMNIIGLQKNIRKKQNKKLRNHNIQNEENDEESISKATSNAQLEYSKNDSMNLVLTIPLLNEKYETIKIEFKKEIKDIKKQYEKLKKKFLKIKNIAFQNENRMDINNNYRSNYNDNNPYQDQYQPNPQIILNKIKEEFQSNF